MKGDPVLFWMRVAASALAGRMLVGLGLLGGGQESVWAEVEHAGKEFALG